MTVAGDSVTGATLVPISTGHRDPPARVAVGIDACDQAKGGDKINRFEYEG
jgi:hypothetical protein